MKKILLSLLIVALLLTSANQYSLQQVYAKTQAEIQKEQDALAQKQEQYEKEIKELETEKNVTIDHKNLIDSQVETTSSLISNISSVISNLSNEIKEKTSELNAQTVQFEKYYALYKERVRDTFENGSDNSFLAAILGDKSFGEILSQKDAYSKILEYDNQLMDKMNEEIKKITQTKKEIENKKVQNQSEKSKLDSQKANLEQQSAKSQALMNEIASDKAEYEKLARETQNRINQLAKELADMLDQKSSYVGGTYLWPVPGFTNISSPFGMRASGMHYGTDISGGGRVITGANIVAANSGKVVKAGWDRLAGWYVSIDHGGKQSTTYMHMNTAPIVSVGQSVSKGQVIGYVGSTGNSTGPHLHFEIAINGTRVNPMNYFKKS